MHGRTYSGGKFEGSTGFTNVSQNKCVFNFIKFKLEFQKKIIL